MTLTFGQDHGAVAWGYELRQFQAKPRLQALVRGLCSGMAAVDTMLSGLANQRDIATAYGAQLDGIGDIVGQTRLVQGLAYVTYFGFADQSNAGTFGEAPLRDVNQSTTTGVLLDDTSYRALLRLKVALNNGHGTIPEIINSCLVIFNASSIILTKNAPASISLLVYSNLSSGSPVYQRATSYVPTAAGITVAVTFASPALPTGVFDSGTFDGSVFGP